MDNAQAAAAGREGSKPQSVTINIPDRSDKMNANNGNEDSWCVNSEDLKYRMVRIHVDKLDLNIVEQDLISNLNVRRKIVQC